MEVSSLFFFLYFLLHKPISFSSTYGVTIPLELLKLLASVKDFNKAHKELYWKSLKDERLIPFLAYSIAYGDNSTVYNALTIVNHTAQIQNFRIKL